MTMWHSAFIGIIIPLEFPKERFARVPKMDLCNRIVIAPSSLLLSDHLPVESQTPPGNAQRRHAPSVLDVPLAERIDENSFLRPYPAQRHHDNSGDAPRDDPVQRRQQCSDGRPKEQGVHRMPRIAERSAGHQPRRRAGQGTPALAHVRVHFEKKTEADPQDRRSEELHALPSSRRARAHPSRIEGPQEAAPGEAKKVSHERDQEAQVFAVATRCRPCHIFPPRSRRRRRRPLVFVLPRSRGFIIATLEHRDVYAGDYEDGRVKDDDGPDPDGVVGGAPPRRESAAPRGAEDDSSRLHDVGGFFG
mmetsp:Transcript_17714/g.38364  ORF Transcript_17714/g.38364 Transcript_17714/m.38364 type:complete len:305 (-) Transcript_17714:14-928(-)